jgi:hypothetical protein
MMPVTEPSGEERLEEAVEVVIMLSEDELAHCCYYCGMPEQVFGDHWDIDRVYKKIGGQGSSSTYGCWDVSTSLLVILALRLASHLFP